MWNNVGEQGANGWGETQEISDRGNQVGFEWTNEPERNSDRLTRQWWLWFPAAGHQTTPLTFGPKNMKAKLILIGLIISCAFTLTDAHPSVPYIGLTQNSNNVTVLRINGRELERKEDCLTHLQKLASVSKEMSIFVLVEPNVPKKEFKWLMNSLQHAELTNIRVFSYRTDGESSTTQTNEHLNAAVEYIDRARFQAWLLPWKETHEILNAE